MLRCHFRTRQYVKIFSLLHAGKRTRHSISRKVPTGPVCHDSSVQCIFHQFYSLIRRQIMKLYSLTGRQFHPADPVLLHTLRQKSQSFLCKTSASHWQTKHMTSLSLGITAKPARNALISFTINLPRLKCPDFFRKYLYIFSKNFF